MRADLPSIALCLAFLHCGGEVGTPSQESGAEDALRRSRSFIATLVSSSQSGALGNGASRYPKISGDGRLIAFESNATNLVVGAPAGRATYVRNLSTGSIERFDGTEPSLSPDGDWIAVNVNQTILLRSRVSGAEHWVSDNGMHPAVSSSGTHVSFAAYSLGSLQIYRYERATGEVLMTSVARDGGPGIGVDPNGNCSTSAISADGRYVAFYSAATNLVDGDSNGFTDAFVRDFVQGTTERVSLSSLGAEANDKSGCGGLGISDDGRYVTFQTQASNFDDTWLRGAYVRDRVLGTTELVGRDELDRTFTAEFPAISADGRFVTFVGFANFPDAGYAGGSDIWLLDRENRRVRRVSTNAQGMGANQYTMFPAISADGAFVAYQSNATNLTAVPTDGETHIFRAAR